MSTPSRTDAEGLGDKPSPRPRADLSGAFGPPNRSGGLAGRLARPAPRTATPDSGTTPGAESPSSPPAERTAPAPTVAAERGIPTTPEVVPPTTEQTGARSTKKSSRRKAGRSETTQSSGGPEGGTVTSIVYLAGDLLERLRRARAATGFTYTHLVLDALDGTHERLAELVAQATAPRARPAGSLFSGPSSAAAIIQPKVQITLRPRSSDAAVIDQLATSHGVSRSQLVALALSAHLDAS